MTAPAAAAAPPAPSPHFSNDAGLALRLPRAAWILSIAALIVGYGFLFVVVHPLIDTRICRFRLDDPLFALIPYNPRWFLVSHQLYYVMTAGSALAFIWQARRGDHRPLLRFLLALSLQAFFRSLTMSLVPLCRANITPGTAPLAAAPTIGIGPVRIPFRTWATNDLLFSGHVGEFLLVQRAGHAWPRIARIGMLVFQAVQAVALIGTRGHYTIDIVVAIPFAVLADLTSLALLARLPGARAQAAPGSAPASA